MIQQLTDNLFSEDKRCLVLWEADATETPIKVHVGGADFSIAPNTHYDLPETVWNVLNDSGHDVKLLGTREDLDVDDQPAHLEPETEPATDAVSEPAAAPKKSAKAKA